MTRKKFTRYLTFAFCYFVGYFSRVPMYFDRSVPTRNDSQIINEIYKEAINKSAETFLRNGGLVDASMISLGHGSKIRLWDYFGPS